MKKPGDLETTWHQASTYIAERKYKPALEPRDINSLFQLTTWIAIDDAFFENGCMHFLKGTHKKMWTVKMGGREKMGEWTDTANLISGSGSFAQVKNEMVLEIPMKPEMVTGMPLKAGQCVIFTERCMHGAPPNRSDKRRFGMVFRTIKTDVQVYRGDKEAAVTVLQENYDLEKWGCMVLRGQDQYHLNRLLLPPKPEKQPTMAAAG